MSRLTAAVAIAIATILGVAGNSARAQVRVVVNGAAQEVPANTVRVITVTNGRMRIIDSPWAGGEATPGAASITTTETVEEDGNGHVLLRKTITRIEPQRLMVAYAQPEMRPAQMPKPIPRIEVDMNALAEGSPLEVGKPRAMRIKRDQWGGHFVAPVIINGVEIKAIIDTGAAYTILSVDDARATGADRNVERSEIAIGIGGYTRVGVTKLSSMEIGGQKLGAMTVRIGQPGIPYTLLGQTEIARLGRVTIEDGIMTITPRTLAKEIAMR